MLMEDFYTYIGKITSHPGVDWHPTDNQVIRLMYRTLGWLVRDGWDSLIFTRTHVLYGKDGNLSKHFDEIECHESRATDLSECTPFREAMRLIMEHDERVREHFHLAEATPEAVTYHIVPEVIGLQ
jgi:hypothetical protein